VDPRLPQISNQIDGLKRFIEDRQIIPKQPA